MADHKRATEVTIAPLQERSEFQEFVHRYWKLGAAALVAISAVVLFVQGQARQTKAVLEGSWEQLGTKVDLASMRLDGAGPQLALAAEELDATPAGVFARCLEVAAFYNDRNYDEASQALNRLRDEYGDHPFVSTPRNWGSNDLELTLIQHYERQIQQWAEWSEAHPGVFGNADPAADAPRVRLKTSKGDIVLALYSDRAPNHVANFLKLCSDGYYLGSKFHRIIPGSIIQGGDPNTIDGDPDTWGLGGPETGVDPEDSGLWHFEGVLAAAKKPGATESSGSQFYITLGPTHQFDGDYVVFGAVLEGLAVAREIGTAEREGSTERPVLPVSIEATEVL